MAKIKAGSRIGPFPYRIVKALDSGQGNMSDVYLASIGDDATLDPARLVVIKISRAQDEHQDFYQDTIYNESERLRKLYNPGIVRILPIQTDNDMRQLPYVARASALPGQPWFLVLEYLDGGSLAQVLQSGPLDIPLALEIARSLAATLDYIHRNDLVHLDIKPENIIFRQQLAVGARVEPVFIDFGIARNTGQRGLEARTIHYAPPERVLLNRGNHAPETVPRPEPSMDVYSLGVVLYQMVTGRRPFEGRSDRGISSAILAGHPTEPVKYKANIPPALNRLILQTMDKEPINRPTAAELVQQLEELAGKSHVVAASPAKTAPRPAPARRQRRASPWLRVTMAFVILMLLLLAAQAVYVVQWGEPWLPTSGNIAQLGSTVRALGAGLLPQNNPDGELQANTAPGNAVGAGSNSAVASANGAAPADPPTSAPTSTPVPEFTAIPTAASAAVVTLAPSPTTRPPTSTPVALPPTATKAPTTTSTATATASATASATAQRTSTSTPVRPTATPRRPTATPVVLPSPTPTNTVAPVARAPASPTPVRSVRLIAPSDGAGGYRMEFRWEANFALDDRQAFEPIFWKEGQDPFVSGRGWGGTTRNSSKTIEFRDPAPDNYLWGILLVETEPAYKRLTFLGGGWRFSIQDEGGSSASGNSGNGDNR